MANAGHGTLFFFFFGPPSKQALTYTLEENPQRLCGKSLGLSANLLRVQASGHVVRPSLPSENPKRGGPCTSSTLLALRHVYKVEFRL